MFARHVEIVLTEALIVKATRYDCAGAAALPRVVDLPVQISHWKRMFRRGQREDGET